MGKTAFDPKVHGYRFTNRADSAWGIVGVCGGMSWSAVDFFFHPDLMLPSYDDGSFPNGVLVEGWKSTANDPTLAGYIWRRQMDSVNANGGGFLLALSVPPDSATNFKRLKLMLDAGQPVPIALPGMTANAFDGHHVVAIDYQEAGGNRDILVYDPNRPNETALLRIVANDKLTEHTATQAGGTWTAGASFATWKGFWIADGFAPETPPGGLEDIILTSVSAPSLVDSATTFDVSFEIANVGEFDTRINSVGLRIDGNVLNVQSAIPGGRLPLSHTFKTSPFQLTLPAGEHTIEPVFFRDQNSPARSLGTRRKVMVVQGWPKGSSVLLGGLEGGPRVSPVLGKLLSGPTLFNPHVPFKYEVTEYKVALKVWIEDDYGGGTFADPMKAVTAKLDHGQLRSVNAKVVGPRSATIEALFDPVAGKNSTVLRVTVLDSAGNAFDTALAVPCDAEHVVPKIDLNHRIPDLHGDPFGRPPFGRPVVPPRPLPGVLTGFDPRVRVPRR